MSIQIIPSQLGATFAGVGSALGSALQQRGQRAFQREERETEFKRKRDVEEAARLRQQQTSTLLQQTVSALGEDASPLKFAGALNQVLEAGGDPETVKQYGTLLSTLRKGERGGAVFEAQTNEERTALFQDFGMDESTAQRFSALYPTLSRGGKTAFTNYLFDSLQRQDPSASLFGGPGIQPEGAPPISPLPSREAAPPSGFENVEPLSAAANVEAAEEPDFQFPTINAFQGLTAKDKVARQKEFSKDNTPLYSEAVEKVKGFKRSGRSIRQLTNLNDSGKLPTGLGKAINVDYKTGDLRVPSGANPETQLYVKTVNEFVKGAKDSFGARVTNFELDRFLQQLPTLANTADGRRLILKQMNVINDLNQLESDSLKETYNNYGLRGIDVQQANTVAEKLRGRKERELIEDFDRVPQEIEIYTAKQNTPSGQVAVEIDGQLGYVPEAQKEAVRAQGGRVL